MKVFALALCVWLAYSLEGETPKQCKYFPTWTTFDFKPKETESEPV